ncbi:MAG: SsrA-binding protein SmpB [Gammaproteobacteria bacterium]|nr:MAG: SsrA-binding protein SmpB [Gammaproteobacteria bacterium]
MSKKKPKAPSNTIAQNKKARHDYFIEDRFEAGLALEGWEVKSLRAGRVQLTEGYVRVEKGEAWLLGVHIAPLATASTHIHPHPDRPRKLLLHAREIDKLIGAVDRKGYTLAPLSMYWKHGRAKLEIGLARGKQSHDKRASIKKRETEREIARALKKG